MIGYAYKMSGGILCFSRIGPVTTDSYLAMCWVFCSTLIVLMMFVDSVVVYSCCIPDIDNLYLLFFSNPSRN
jgi:TM2 domain-containing membrane protein YozV